jgi:hypothetical protein
MWKKNSGGRRCVLEAAAARRDVLEAAVAKREREKIDHIGKPSSVTMLGIIDG